MPYTGLGHATQVVSLDILASAGLDYPTKLDTYSSAIAPLIINFSKSLTFLRY